MTPAKKKAPKKKPPKVKWEYKNLLFPNNKVPWDYISDLNDLGEDGWEIAIMIDASEFILKRPL
jgi:hypothetical protein